jgi:hypothetical protein
MRVADSVRVTSFVRRLRVGDKFSDHDGDWEVTRAPEIDNGTYVTVYIKPYPDGSSRSRAYKYHIDSRVNVIH